MIFSRVPPDGPRFLLPLVSETVRLLKWVIRTTRYEATASYSVRSEMVREQMTSFLRQMFNTSTPFNKRSRIKSDIFTLLRGLISFLDADSLDLTCGLFPLLNERKPLILSTRGFLAHLAGPLRALRLS
jgi:hypothetical protein